MEESAKAYDESSGPQIEAGSRFIRDLNLSLGNKVLDMGCGTGHLTKYIADIVGPNGLAVGVDPDAERIKIAQEKSKEASNLQFCVGSSAVGFPHDNEPFYDVHISTNTFHWIHNDEKPIYIQKAHRCLKPGGRLAIWCPTAKSNDEKAKEASSYAVSREGCQGLFQETGLFKNVSLEQSIHPYRFKSVEEFKQWFKSTTQKDPDDFPQLIEKLVTTDDDGQATFNVPYITINACKA